MLKNALWLFAFTIVILAVFLPSYAKMQDLREKNSEYAKRIQALQKRNVELEEERRLLETDPSYLERVAREKMGLLRQGEKVYRMVPADTKPPAKVPAKPAAKPAARPVAQ